MGDGARHLAEAWLDQMFEPCAVYRLVREHGVVVDFERTFLNGAGRVAVLHAGGDERVTSMLEEAPGLIEVGLFEQYVRVAETGVPWTGMSQVYADDKRSMVLDLQAWRVPEGIAITWRDVTERERLAEELRLSEQRFRATVDQLRDAVSVLEAVHVDGQVVDLRWVYANAGQAGMLGRAADQLVGRTVLEVFPGPRSAALVATCAAVLEDGETRQGPTVWIDDVQVDGQPRRRAFDIRFSPVDVGCVVVGRDVTELQRLRSGPGEAEPAG